MKKKPNALSIILILIILAFALPKIFHLYVYIKLDTSSFPLVQKWSANIRDSILELSAADDDFVVFASTDNALYAIDAVTGRELWHFPLNHQVKTSPAIAHNGIVYIADAKSLWALDQRNGDIVWSKSLSEPRGKVEDAPEGLVFVNNTNDEIGSYDARTGRLV